MLLPALIIGDPNPKPDVITGVLYEFLSAASNNGSEVGGFLTNTFFFNIIDGVLMLLGRFVLMGLQLAIAQSFATKSPKVETGRTVETGSPLFALMLFVTMIMLGVLSFFPVLAMGPFLSWAKDFNLFIGGLI
jgi:K+-transporting ATPase ATPase A chain